MSPEPSPPVTGPEQYIFITPVWGEAYVERFVKISLPSQLSSGNLGSVPADRALYLIYTRREDVGAIRNSVAFKRLKAMMPVSIRSLDDLPRPDLQSNPHELQTAAYMRGIAAGDGKQAAFVFLTPDILIGEGSFRNMVNLTEQGKRVILVAGIRMTSDGAVACIARHAGADRGVVPIPPRALVRSCMDSPHPLTKGHIVSDDTVLAAQHFYWRVGEHDLLVRGFHIHPILVWPREAEAAIRNTLDDEYVSRACPDRTDWHTVTDSDEMCVIEFSDRNHKVSMLTPRPMTDCEIVSFIADGTTPDHRVHLLERIRFHTNGLDPAKWEPVQSRSDAFVQKYLDLFEHGFAEPAAPASPQCRSNLQERLKAMFGRGPNAIAQNKVSLARLLVLGLLAPLWVLFRIVNYKLYRYLDRLNAEVIEMRALLHHTRVNVQASAERMEVLARQLAIAEDNISRAKPPKRMKSEYVAKKHLKAR